jgi:polysaccharide biosynthesis protein PslG
MPALASASVPRSFWGVNWAYYNSLTGKELKQMHSAKIQSVRTAISWSSIERTQGVFDWSEPDEAIGALAAKGIRVIPILNSTPYWVTGRTFNGVPLDGQHINTPPVGSPAQEQHWENFLVQVVDRYGPNGDFWTGPYLHRHPGKPVLPIHAWQIWNEPNIPGAFRPQPDVDKYAELLKISHDTILAQDPTATIILGGVPARTQYPGWTFLNDLYHQTTVPNIANYFDMVAIHPYSDNQALVESAVQRFHDTLVLNNDGATPLWVSEFSWGSGPPDGHLNVTPNGQAYAMLQSFKAFAKHQADWNLVGVSWFNWRDPPDNRQNPSCPWCQYAGLFAPNDKPKPVWDVFKHFTAGTKLPPGLR